ncbi:hypothetical protein EFA46_015085 (plasmid) [Halarchaeum sp. CBA1220]|uniref:hypothetical protein n=1 Tax=Halarchaeum sp. CBA1220 TaxID=1853682 RepID=UPI000F3A9124|nr:hypothetical protein [Halarchaeum sp. CBA1220]QLC35553.1 hypothetical protein EFA46_015085 [Halarchaeum sp. CBA1220]
MQADGRDYQPGDVVWTVDPFKTGTSVSRMFCIVSTRTHPFEDEQFVGCTLTTTDHAVAHPLYDHYWELGGTPEQSYILPLSLHTPRAANIQAPPDYAAIDDPWQGRITDALLDQIIEEIVWTLRRR